MRCMTAIWPAGPPKLRPATFSQTRNASRRVGYAGLSAHRCAGGAASSLTWEAWSALGVIDDMMRPCVGADAILRHVASWGDRVPHDSEKIASRPVCQAH